jgi:hypothetical protein
VNWFVKDPPTYPRAWAVDMAHIDHELDHTSSREIYSPVANTNSNPAEKEKGSDVVETKDSTVPLAGISIAQSDQLDPDPRLKQVCHRDFYNSNVYGAYITVMHHSVLLTRHAAIPLWTSKKIFGMRTTEKQMHKTLLLFRPLEVTWIPC